MWEQGRRPSPGQAVPDRPPPEGEAGLRWWNWDTLYIVLPNYLLPPEGEAGLRWWNWDTLYIVPPNYLLLPEGEAGLRWWNRDALYIVLPNYLLPPPGEGGPGASPGRMRAAPGGSIARINSLEKIRLRAAPGGRVAV